MTRNVASIEAWAEQFLSADTLAGKLAPCEPPARFESHASQVQVPKKPGRPDCLQVVTRAPRLRGAHRSQLARARAAHTFLHHELQAAELMCWCLLRFPDAPERFRRGLLRIALDEVRHMQMYEEYLRGLGYEVGAFPVRDWFWERIPRCDSPVSFVAAMGLGFEAANLDHSERFALLFAEAGDKHGAALQRHVGREELGHVRFAAHWFRTFSGTLDFETWQRALPAPLSPMVMRGDPVQVQARERAGLGSDFCEALVAWQPKERRSTRVETS